MITNRNGDCNLNSYAIAVSIWFARNMDEIEIEMTEVRSTLGISKRPYTDTLHCIVYTTYVMPKSDLKSLSELHNNSNGLFVRYMYETMMCLVWL